MNCEAFLSLLQFSDGLFPVGSYAHSFGLETYAVTGAIRDAKGVERFLLSYLQGSVAPTDAVAALAAQEAVLSQCSSKLEHCAVLDRRLDAMKPASELRNASRQMGRQVLRVAAELGEPFAINGLTADLLRTVENGETPGHHAIAFGVIGAAAGWPGLEMTHSYLYATCSGLVAAALRLIPLGQLAGQRILCAVAPSIIRLAGEIQGKDVADAWSFAPAIEIASMRHATLDARLFRS